MFFLHGKQQLKLPRCDFFWCKRLTSKGEGGKISRAYVRGYLLLNFLVNIVDTVDTIKGNFLGELLDKDGWGVVV